MLRALTALGGVARRGALVRVCGRAAVDAAVRAKTIVPVARGTWASAAGVDEALAAAKGLTGVLSLRSAAMDHGWAVRTVPEKPEVTVARNRRIPEARRRDVSLRWATLHADDIDGHRTSADRTIVDCLRTLPFAEALAVADSALRCGMSFEHLRAVARDVRGPGAPRVRHVAAVADGRAAGPFESSLRAICLDVDGLQVVPQVAIHDPGWLGRPDLVDERLRIVLEADSFTWHGDRRALRRDARRYNALVAAGWLVLRFSWEDVMFEPELVAETLRAVVKRRAEVMCVACAAA